MMIFIINNLLRFILRISFVPFIPFSFLFDVLLVNIFLHVGNSGWVWFGFTGKPGVLHSFCGSDSFGGVNPQTAFN